MLLDSEAAETDALQRIEATKETLKDPISITYFSQAQIYIDQVRLAIEHEKQQQLEGDN